jgi:RNA polymerase sigma factor (sigma-70 family)
MELVPADPESARRRNAALALLPAAETALRRTARRYSLCQADAEDALQRAIEILLTKAPPLGAPTLTAWMHVVTRNEALAVRRARERLLGVPWGGHGRAAESVRAVAPPPARHPGSEEELERRDRLARAADLLAALKPQERRAIVLQAEGYSYAEIQAITGWSYTKVNRCLAEGRARLRALGAIA